MGRILGDGRTAVRPYGLDGEPWGQKGTSWMVRGMRPRWAALGRKGAEQVVGLGEDAAVHAVAEVIEDTHEVAGAVATVHDALLEEDGPLVEGLGLGAVVAGDGGGHLVAEVGGHGAEAVDLELGGVLTHELVDVVAELGVGGHGFTSRSFINPYSHGGTGGTGFRVFCARWMGFAGPGYSQGRDGRNLPFLRTHPDRSGGRGVCVDGRESGGGARERLFCIHAL